MGIGAGFRIEKGTMHIDSCAFNKYGEQGNQDGYRDEYSTISEAEGSLLVGAFVTMLKDGYKNVSVKKAISTFDEGKYKRKEVNKPMGTYIEVEHGKYHENTE